MVPRLVAQLAVAIGRASMGQTALAETTDRVVTISRAVMTDRIRRVESARSPTAPKLPRVVPPGAETTALAMAPMDLLVAPRVVATRRPQPRRR